MAGAEMGAPKRAVFNGIEVDLEALVVWSPEWAMGYRAVCQRLSSAAHVRITQRSALVLDGDITLGALVLDGALLVVARPGVRVHIKRLAVHNEGWQLEPAA